MSFYNNFKKWGWRLAITLVLLLFLILKINLSEIVGVFSKTNILLLMLSLPLFFSLHLIRAIKWNIALECIGVRMSLLKSLKIVMIGTFYGTITPGRAGELARAYYVKEKKSKIMPTVIWDKAVEIGSLVFLSVLSILVFFKNTQLVYTIIFIAFVFILFIILILNKKVIGLVTKIIRVDEKHKVVYFESITKIGRNKGAILKMFFWSIFFYLATITVAIFVLIALKPSASPLLVFSLPLIILIGNAPITISGLGLREGIAAFSFRLLGEQASVGFSFSLILFLIMSVIPGIVGYLLVLKETKPGV